MKQKLGPLFGGILFALCPHVVASLMHGSPPIAFELMAMVMEIVMATAMAMPCK